MITARDVLPELYAGCDGLVELRALPSLARCFSTIGDTERRLAFAKQHQKQNLYWGVAARKSDENGTEANCQHLAALYADLDFSKTPETEARERLAQTPLSPSLIVNSGGGLHVYWFLREPLDVQHEQPRLWLQRLATYLHADPQCAEPARVLRVPGTKNYKYDPPRAVTVESFAPDKRYNLGDFDSWLPAASDLPAATTAPQIEGPILQGSRNDLLFRLARSLKAKNIDPSALRLAVQSVNQAQCHPPLPNAEVESIVRGAVTQANRPDFNGDTGAPGIAIVTCLADVRMRPIDWHWRQRFARGKATIVAGEPGVSKSSLWIDMVSRSTRGGQWPDGGAITACDCVIMTAEDALDDTVKPRLVAADANLSRVHALAMVRDAGSDEERLVNLERDIAVIEQVVCDTSAGLVWIDPIGAYLPSKLDSKTDHQVRAVLAPLAKLAERRNVALGLVMHLAKNAERRVLHRILGSIGFVAAARIVLAVAEDPDDTSRRLLLPVKANICAPAATLAYRVSQTIVETDDGPCETLRLDWDAQPVEGLHVDDVFRGAKEDAAERVDAETFLRDYLADSPKDAREILAAAESNGIARSTLFRIKSKLGIRATRVGGVGASGRWIWSLTVSSPAKGLTQRDGTLRTLSENRPTKSPTTTKNLNIVSKTLSEEEPLDRY